MADWGASPHALFSFILRPISIRPVAFNQFQSTPPHGGDSRLFNAEPAREHRLVVKNIVSQPLVVFGGLIILGHLLFLGYQRFSA